MALYAFDGTWNEDEKDEGRVSNVVRFREAPISKNFDPKLDPRRKIPSGDPVRAAVQPRGESGGRHHNDPPAGLRVVSE